MGYHFFHVKLNIFSWPFISPRALCWYFFNDQISNKNKNSKSFRKKKVNKIDCKNIKLKNIIESDLGDNEQSKIRIDVTRKLEIVNYAAKIGVKVIYKILKC